MLLRLRQALPLLQTFNRWSAIAPVPRFRSFAAASATADGDGALPAADAAGGEAPKPKRARRATTAAAAEPSSSGSDVKPAPKKRASRKAAVDSAAEAESGPAAAAPSEDGAEPKKRASRRKAQAAEAADADAGASTSGVPEGGEAGAAAAKPKATRTRRSKAAAEPAAEAASEAAAADGETQPPKKRASRRKATGNPEDGEEESISIRSLPYEECLVLPRQAEALLVVLGLRPHPYTHEPAPPSPAGSPAPAASPPSPRRSTPGTPLRNVLELSEFEGKPQLTRYAEPLLLAQYQGLLGDSPDYLYDMFLLDAGPPHLDSDVVREAVVNAARTVGQTASSRTAKAVYTLVWKNLEAAVGEEVLLEQERRLTDAQIELFLLDWSSALITGRDQANTRTYLARRCAALTLKSPATIERLHLYANQGCSLMDLKERANVSIKTPMSALIEGLKSGVALPRQRLLDDFRLGEGTGLGSRLQELLRLVRSHAADSAEPGSSSYYNTLRGKLTTMPEVAAVVREQERRWQAEMSGTGEDLTTNQLRLLFHLERLDRFKAEYQARLAGHQQPQATGAGQDQGAPPGGFSA
ncbi:hypothetical protein HXX76_000227 [Chlamydomonas incerta]|uniref:Uncharacterized protein n=1 Tax=Chlamydomonas incerta TaxID=51695 RepID=A0A835WDW3_CHLIN|nr:hypothetical protein HXX76_000227 [Chlamydomonas incerta]|eukprot:KAG2445617.1 hypothetical protein HXX76_000227 [Chlamydomonas incerta]